MHALLLLTDRHHSPDAQLSILPLNQSANRFGMDAPVTTHELATPLVLSMIIYILAKKVVSAFLASKPYYETVN